MVWDKVVQPDWQITMVMWPTEKARVQQPGPPVPPGITPAQVQAQAQAQAVNGQRTGHHHHRATSVPGISTTFVRPNGTAPRPPQPPAGWTPAMGGMPPPPPPPPGMPPVARPNIVDVVPPAKAKEKKIKPSPVLGWMAGAKPVAKPTKK